MTNASPGPPRPNPLHKILALVLAAVSIISFALAFSAENEIYFLVAMVSGALAGGSFKFYRGLTSATDEWHYRKSKTSFEEKELILDDHFKLVVNPPVLSDEDPIACTVHYIFSQNALYQIHPYETERFEAAKARIGDRFKARIIVEDGQHKILECAVAVRATVSSEEVRANQVTAKFFGHYPKLSTGYNARDTYQRIKDWVLVYDGRVLKNLNGGSRSKCYVLVNGDIAEVSMQDFLLYKVGDAIPLAQLL